MAYAVMTTETESAYGYYSYGLYSHCLYSYGLCFYGLYCYDIFSYDNREQGSLHSVLHRATAAPHRTAQRHKYIVMAHIFMAYVVMATKNRGPHRTMACRASLLAAQRLGPMQTAAARQKSTRP